jgi:hypothetical protein
MVVAWSRGFEAHTLAGGMTRAIGACPCLISHLELSVGCPAVAVQLWRTPVAQTVTTRAFAIRTRLHHDPTDMIHGRPSDRVPHL